MSIDDATPDEWNNLKVTEGWSSYKGYKTPAKYDLNGPDQHPLFPTKDEPIVAEAAMTKSYKFKTVDDAVDSPAHYNLSGDIECIDSIQAMLTPDEFIGYLRGNSHKYRWRFRYKNKPIEANDPKILEIVIRTAFNQRRKTLRNSLKTLLRESKTTSSVDLSLRPETLSLGDYIEISNSLTGDKHGKL